MLKSTICIISLTLSIMEGNAGFQKSNMNNISPRRLQTQIQQPYEDSLQKIIIPTQIKQQRNLDPNLHFNQNQIYQQQQNQTKLKGNIIRSHNQGTQKIFNTQMPVQVSTNTENIVEQLSKDIENKIEEHRLSLTNNDKIQTIELKKQDYSHKQDKDFAIIHEKKGFIDSVVNFFKGIYDVSGPAQMNLDPLAKLDNSNNTQSQMYNQTNGADSLQIQHINTTKYSQQNMEILEKNMQVMKRKKRKMQFIISVFLFGITAIILIKVSEGKEKLSQAKYIWRSIASKLPSNDEGEQI